MWKRYFALVLAITCIFTIFSACKKDNIEEAESEFEFTYTFTLDGESYVFPSRMNMYLDSEWGIVSSADGSEVDSAKHLVSGQRMMIYIKKNNTIACVVCENDKSDDVTLGDSLVTDVNFTTAKDGKPLDFSFVDGKINSKTSLTKAKEHFEEMGYNVSTKSSPGDVNDLIVSFAVCQLRLEYSGKDLIQVNFYFD